MTLTFRHVLGKHLAYLTAGLVSYVGSANDKQAAVVDACRLARKDGHDTEALEREWAGRLF